ncbi:MAG TPA: hypothetical protein VLH59_03785 [Ignavibacteriaceae bacterium]|nr:hypothetical protein [Ignavibacteriaceae bacterium]
MNKYSKKSYRSFLLLIFSFLIFNLSAVGGFFSAEATVRYVSKTGLSIPPYTSWLTAADSIQKCINICVFGDTIYVANGVYEEKVVMIPGLALIGSGTDSCTVDSRAFPPSGNRTITMKDSCLVTGFYIRTSNDFNYGQGIRAEGQGGLVTSNKFSNSNNGIYLYNSNTTVYKNYCFNLRTGVGIANSNSIVRKNEIYTIADQIGNGIFITGLSDDYNPIIDSNYIATKTGGIRKSIGTRPTIKNNVIEFIQYGAEAIYLSSSDSAKVFNNLIFVTDQIYDAYGIHNSGTQYLQANNNYFLGEYLRIFYVGPDNKVKNNVVTNAEGEIRAWGNQNLQYQFNDVWNSNVSYAGLDPDTTNVSVNPMIVNYDSTQGKLDFHLQMFSPLIDAGDPNILDKNGTRSDIGLYGGPYGESYIYVDLPPRSPVNLTAAVDSSIVTLNWNKNTESDFSYYNLFYDTTGNFQIDSTKLISSQPDTFYYFVIPAGVESLYFKLTAVDNQGNESNPSEEVGVVVTSVKDEWKPLNNYILYQNYPNPFNPSTKIGYKLKERGYVKLYVYDIKGELVSVLVNEVQEVGYYEVEFSATNNQHPESSIKNLASGVYIYQIFVSNERSIPVFSDIKKMLIIK